MLASALPGSLEPLLTAAPGRVHRIERRDGTSIALIASRAALGAPELTAGSIIVAEDVTAQQNAEEKLRHSQRVDAVGRLASGVTHDFNNLLAVMAAGVNVLQEALGPDSNLREELAVLDTATQQGAALTRQLLSFTRPGPRRPEVFDVRRVVEATERMLRRLVPSTTALTMRVADEPLHVLMDPGQLEQVLVNLTLNARDALPEGGRIEISALRIVAAGAAQSTVELRIADDGVGMDEATRHCVFEPFFTTKPEGRGTGLGLAVVRDIVVEAGGQVTLDSAPGRGTTVRVLLPLA